MPHRVIMASCNPFVLALRDALGLPKNTISFDLHCAAGEPVTVQCTFHPCAEGVEGFDPAPLTRMYRLVEGAAIPQGEVDVTTLADDAHRFWTDKTAR